MGALRLSLKPPFSHKAEGRHERDCHAYGLLLWHNVMQACLGMEKGCMLILLQITENLQSFSEHRLMFCKVPNWFTVCAACYQITVWEKGIVILNPKPVFKKMILLLNFMQYSCYCEVIPHFSQYFYVPYSNAKIKDRKALLISLLCLFLVLVMPDTLLVSFLKSATGCRFFSWICISLAFGHLPLGTLIFCTGLGSSSFLSCQRVCGTPVLNEYPSVKWPDGKYSFWILLKKVWWHLLKCVGVPWRVMDEGRSLPIQADEWSLFLGLFYIFAVPPIFVLLNLPVTGRDLLSNWVLVCMLDVCVLFGMSELRVWVELTAEEEGLLLKDYTRFRYAI